MASETINTPASVFWVPGVVYCPNVALVNNNLGPEFTQEKRLTVLKSHLTLFKNGTAQDAQRAVVFNASELKKYLIPLIEIPDPGKVLELEYRFLNVSNQQITMDFESTQTVKFMAVNEQVFSNLPLPSGSSVRLILYVTHGDKIYVDVLMSRQIQAQQQP